MIQILRGGKKVLTPMIDFPRLSETIFPVFDGSVGSRFVRLGPRIVARISCKNQLLRQVVPNFSLKITTCACYPPIIRFIASTNLRSMTIWIAIPPWSKSPVEDKGQSTRSSRRYVIKDE
jgi:hypothetical protein